MTESDSYPPVGAGPGAPPPDFRGTVEMDEKAAEYYQLPQWKLMWRRFRKHKVALWMLHVVILLYVICLNCEFLAPYDPSAIHKDWINLPPQVLRFGFVEGSSLPRLYVYPFKMQQDPVTLERVYSVDRSRRIPIRWLVRGRKWTALGLFESNLHLFGVAGSYGTGSAAAPPGVPASAPATQAAASRPTSAPTTTSATATTPASGRAYSAPLARLARTERSDYPTCFLLGTDSLGQDLFSRIFYGGRISLLIGLTGVLLTFFLGIGLGGISGYYGGRIDMLIQRVAEVIQTVPKIPMWLALAAAIPKNWTSLQVYFAMTLILASMGWSGLCRTVRGKLLALREEDYARAALLAGASESRIIFVHLIPNFLSHITASLTLSVPGMILAETSLSFLGLGLRPPIVSWGVLLQQANRVDIVINQPWLLLPAVMVVIAVLAFNFAGEGLRDAADPYST
ncbi:MAG TPA: ABC transporter permease [Phycisphaerae bacterium]|nr:ABC transporter permease [Phycisphaerae bacterium]